MLKSEDLSRFRGIRFTSRLRSSEMITNMPVSLFINYLRASASYEKKHTSNGL